MEFQYVINDGIPISTHNDDITASCVGTPSDEITSIFCDQAVPQVGLYSNVVTYFFLYR